MTEVILCERYIKRDGKDVKQYYVSQWILKGTFKTFHLKNPHWQDVLEMSDHKRAYEVFRSMR